MQERLVALGDRQLRVDAAGVQTARQQLLDLLAQVVVEALPRHGHERRAGPPGLVGAQQQPHDAAPRHVDQLHERGAQLLDRGGEQLALGQGVEQRADRALVVGVVDDVLEVEDRAQLGAQDRRGAGRLRERLLGEQADDAVLADDAAVVADVLDPHVDHARLAVHGRAAVGARDHQQVVAGEPLAGVGRQRAQRRGVGVVGLLLVAQDAQAGVGDHADRRVGDRVVAGAQHDEVVGGDPAQERDGLVDLGGVVAELRAVGGAVGDRVDPLLHRPRSRAWRRGRPPGRRAAPRPAPRGPRHPAGWAAPAAGRSRAARPRGPAGGRLSEPSAARSTPNTGCMTSVASRPRRASSSVTVDSRNGPSSEATRTSVRPAWPATTSRASSSGAARGDEADRGVDALRGEVEVEAGQRPPQPAAATPPWRRRRRPPGATGAGAGPGARAARRAPRTRRARCRSSMTPPRRCPAPGWRTRRPGAAGRVPRCRPSCLQDRASRRPRRRRQRSRPGARRPRRRPRAAPAA